VARGRGHGRDLPGRIDDHTPCRRGTGFTYDRRIQVDLGFLHERNRLFDFIRDAGVTGVVLVSGDSHVGELNAITWSEHGGYGFYYLVSSPLAQEPPSSWLHRRPERRIRPVYFQGSNVGVIDFMFDGEPRLMYRLFDFVGRSIWEPFVVRAAELVNGVTS